MRGLPSFLLLLRNEFNKLKNTGARMSDYFYNLALELFCARVWCENVNNLPNIRDIVMSIIS